MNLAGEDLLFAPLIVPVVRCGVHHEVLVHKGEYITS